MKRIIPCIVLTIFTLAANAQPNYMTEGFNGSCSVVSGFPSDWSYFNPIAATIPDGQWTCAPGNGRWGTNGIGCTNVWGTPPSYHLDTSYLVSPGMDLSDYPGDIYLHFDTKTTKINLGGKVSMFISSDSMVFDTLGGGTFLDITSTLSPTFGNDDSADWVTHVANLTPFKSLTPLYVAFRYTADNSTGSIWYLDNIFTTTFPVNVTRIDKNVLALKVIGNSTSSHITLASRAAPPGMYHISIYDMQGREIHREDVTLIDSEATNTINGLNLLPGMYLVKMSNGAAYGTVKTVVH